MIKLKPCPFCGGQGEFRRVWNKSIRMVFCGSCGKTPVPYNKCHYYKSNAADDWNKRA